MAVGAPPPQQQPVGLPTPQAPRNQDFGMLTATSPPVQQFQQQVLTIPSNENYFQLPLTTSEYSMYALSNADDTNNVIAARNVSGKASLPPPQWVHVGLNGKKEPFQVDNGCPVAIISEQTYRSVRPHLPPLYPSDLGLRQWTTSPVDIKGFLLIKLTVRSREYVLPLYIGAGSGCNLLGRQWFKPFGIQVEIASEPVSCEVQPAPYPVHSMSPGQATDFLPEAVRKFECFRPGLGCYRGPPVSLRLDPAARPRHLPWRQVAFARKRAVSEEIDRNVREGVYRGPLEHSEYATPIVPIFKRDRRHPRLCGDYRSTINQALEVVKYPMPIVEDALSALANCKVFSKLDLEQAYTQLPVDEESAKLLAVTTHKGIFSVHRVPFGISSGPAIFQRRVCTLLAGIEGVVVWLDDILIAGGNQQDHDERLIEVLRRLSDAGLRLHATKCELNKPNLEYLGFNLDADGLTPLRSRISAVLDAPSPRDVGELRSFIGKMVFYDKFLPNRATILAPLYRLLRDDVQYSWGQEEAKSFLEAKELLCSANLLVHYDLEKELIISCDASPVGLGAVLAHRFADGTERPVEYASRALSKAERNYSQTDRETLSIVFAVNKWHRYLAGRKFEIFTDHKPLLGLFGTSKPIPKVLSPRVERWLVQMGCYNYNVQYRPGKMHGNADTLSRLCIPGTAPKDEDVPEPAGLFLLTSVESPHLTAEQVAKETAKDPELQQVMTWVREGWPTRAPEGEFKRFLLTRGTRSRSPGTAYCGEAEL